MKPWMKYVPGCLLRGHDDFANVAGDTRMESPSTGALLSGIFSCNCFSAPWKESRLYHPICMVKYIVSATFP